MENIFKDSIDLFNTLGDCLRPEPKTDYELDLIRIAETHPCEEVVNDAMKAIKAQFNPNFILIRIKKLNHENKN